MLERPDESHSLIEDAARNYWTLINQLPGLEEVQGVDRDLLATRPQPGAVLWHSPSSSLSDAARQLYPFDLEVRRIAAVLPLYFQDLARPPSAGVELSAPTEYPEELGEEEGLNLGVPRRRRSSLPRPLPSALGHLDIADAGTGSVDLLFAPAGMLIDIFSSRPVMALAVAYELSKPAGVLARPFARTVVHVLRSAGYAGRRLTIRTLKAALRRLGQPIDERQCVAYVRLEVDGSMTIVWIGPAHDRE